MGQPLKLQINSLEALERLIGGDTEMEVELRSTVAHAFAEKHLKGLVKTMAEEGLTNSVKTLIANEILQTIPDPRRSGYSSNTIQVLKPEVRQLLKEGLDKIVTEQVAQLTMEFHEKMLEKMNERFKEIVADMMVRMESSYSDQIINALVNARLQAMLVKLNQA